MYKIAILLSLIFCILNWAHAHQPEGGHILATLGPVLSIVNTVNEDSFTTGPFTMGAALIVEGDVDKNGGVEIGLMYIYKTYFEQTSQGYVEEKIKRMQITSGYRHWFNSHFSTGILYYSAYSMGDPRTVHADFAPGEEVLTSAHKITEYGFDFSFLYEFWQGKETAATLDFRYSTSVSSAGAEDADHFILIFGYKHLVQTKSKTSRISRTP